MCDAEALLVEVTAALGEPANRAWVDEWHQLDDRARAAMDRLLDGWQDPFEGRVARDVVATLPDGAQLVTASSMPVRDVESFAAARDGVRFHANRGVNGIDGFVSTAFGIAAVSAGPTVALVGDLCFLHDANGLLGARERGVDLTFVVVDNDGGGIFSFLPQADLPEHFETVFGTPHGIDLAALAAVHGVPCTEVEKAGALAPALEQSMRAGGVRVVLVRTNRADNVARHREVWRTVEAVLG
jgi:2-succinyl-5-enolpyruvyl-6-hydroxy-3-cyclohexene-1-carboxylate synthase